MSEECLGYMLDWMGEISDNFGGGREQSIGASVSQRRRSMVNGQLQMFFRVCGFALPIRF